MGLQCYVHLKFAHLAVALNNFQASRSSKLQRTFLTSITVPSAFLIPWQGISLGLSRPL